MAPRASVLLPVFNGAATVERAVSSILVQDFYDLEIIAVDDGSTDGTGAILGRLAETDSRLRVISLQRNQGIVAALNLAASAARGDVLVRMDADDFAHPERVRLQLAALDADAPLDAVTCGVRHVSSTGAGMARYVEWLNGLKTPESIHRERFVESPVAHPAVAMRAAAFHEVGGYRDTPWAEDYDLWLRLLHRGPCIGSVPEVLLDWSDEPGRLSRASGRYSLERFADCRAHHLARVPSIARFGVEISGGGPTAKRLARALHAEGVRIHTFFDVHPRRVGAELDGVPVRGVGSMRPASPEAPVQLAAAGTPAARVRIRELLTSLGYIEGHSFFCVA